MKVIRLKTADLSQAMGIDIVNPRLSWNCIGGILQTAYQVVAFGQAEELLFDTGKVESNHMYCNYKGATLPSRMKVMWKVCLWDESNTP